MTSNFTAAELRAMVPRVSVASFAEIAVIQAMLREYAAVKQAVKELGTGPALYEPGVMDWILARAAELSAQDASPKCGWSANDDGFYETSCGKTFVTSDGTAEENGFKFCCFCGKTLTAPEPPK